MKKIRGYSDGDTVPEGAIYLTTITDPVTTYHYRNQEHLIDYTIVEHHRVWHYFLISL